MINKLNHPVIKVKDWISVDGQKCLVTQVYNSYSIFGACEVLTDPQDPINRDVYWTGEQWIFSDRPVFVNAAKTSRLREHLAILQQSQPHPTSNYALESHPA